MTIVAHVRAGHRRAVRIPLAAIKDQYTVVMKYAEAQAYERGVQAGTPTKSTEDTGFERGWRAGYQAAFEQVMGHTGVAARRDEDDGPPPPC